MGRNVSLESFRIPYFTGNQTELFDCWLGSLENGEIPNSGRASRFSSIKKFRSGGTCVNNWMATFM